MNRPYRDDEERQRDKVLVAMEDAEWAVQWGNLDKATVAFCEADMELDKLIKMVETFDKEAQ